MSDIVDIGKYDLNMYKRYIDEMNKDNVNRVPITKILNNATNKSNLKELARKFVPYFASDND